MTYWRQSSVGTKLEKELAICAPTAWYPGRGKSAGQYCEPRNRSGQEARYVRRCKGEDFKGNKGAVGKVQSREEQEGKGWMTESGQNLCKTRCSLSL